MISAKTPARLSASRMVSLVIWITGLASGTTPTYVVQHAPLSNRSFRRAQPADDPV